MKTTLMFLWLSVSLLMAQNVTVTLTTNQVQQVRFCVDLINNERTNAVPPLPPFGYQQWLTNNISLMLASEVNKCRFDDDGLIMQRFRASLPAKQQQIRDALR